MAKLMWHEDKVGVPSWLGCNPDKRGTDDEVAYNLVLGEDERWHVYAGNGETEYRPAHGTLAEAMAWCEEHYQG